MAGLTRRELCAGTALAGVSLGLGACAPEEAAPAPGWTLPPGVKAAPEAGLTLARLQPLVGTAFQIEDGEGRSQRLLLQQVQDRGAPLRTPRPRGEAFTLQFQGEGVMAQGTYRAQHPALGRFSMFLVPRDATSARFAASFSHL
jgi:hypothetical protein